MKIDLNTLKIDLNTLKINKLLITGFVCTLILVTSSCSFQAPTAEWQMKSKNAFSSYTKNFLSSNDLLAKNDLSRSIKHANVSADLTKLARLYLGTCALNISVGIEDTCDQYVKLKGLVNNIKLDSYYAFIQSSIEQKAVQHLPKNYQEFALKMNTGNYTLAIESALNMARPTSKLLAAALIKDKITAQSRNKIINLASYFGYKKVVVFWLRESLNKTTDLNKKKSLLEKITILESTNE